MKCLPLALVMARCSQANDMVIGTPVANRRDQQLEPLIGFFVNTLVLRSDLSNNPSFSSLLKQSKNTSSQENK